MGLKVSKRKVLDESHKRGPLTIQTSRCEDHEKQMSTQRVVNSQPAPTAQGVEHRATGPLSQFQETSPKIETVLVVQDECQSAPKDDGRSVSVLDKLDASTSTSGIPCTHEQEKLGNGHSIMVDEKTSTPQVSPCFCPETIFYHKNQFLGSETRHVEFKRGGVLYDIRAFRTLVGRYLCAFLNTEGGVIYFGVTDDGKAVGIAISQKMEDELRLAVDGAVSSIKPLVPTEAYSINIASVMNDDGKIDAELKVLELCIHPRTPPKKLHSFDNNVYMRRDGSLRTL